MWRFEEGSDRYYGAIRDETGRRINRAEDVFITTAQEVILAHSDETERLSAQLKIAHAALEYISLGAVRNDPAHHLSTMAEDALIQMSAVK